MIQGNDNNNIMIIHILLQFFFFCCCSNRLSKCCAGNGFKYNQKDMIDRSWTTMYLKKKKRYVFLLGYFWYQFVNMIRTIIDEFWSIFNITHNKLSWKLFPEVLCFFFKFLSFFSIYCIDHSNFAQQFLLYSIKNIRNKN